MRSRITVALGCVVAVILGLTGTSGSASASDGVAGRSAHLITSACQVLPHGRISSFDAPAAIVPTVARHSVPIAVHTTIPGTGRINDVHVGWTFIPTHYWAAPNPSDSFGLVRTSGSVRTGTWTGSISVPVGLPGTLSIDEVTVESETPAGRLADTEYARVHQEGVLRWPAAWHDEITVGGTYDTYSPSLDQFAVSRTTVDTSAATQTIDFTAHLVLDPRASAHVGVDTYGDVHSLITTLTRHPDGYFSGSVTIPRWVGAGGTRWLIEPFVVDGSGRVTGQDQFERQLTVTSGTDTSAPRVVGIRLGPHPVHDSTPFGSSMSITVATQDDRSGSMFTRVRIHHAATVGRPHDVNGDLLLHLRRVPGTNNPAVFTVSWPVTTCSGDDANWVIDRITTFDRERNQQNTDYPQLRADGYPTEFRVEH